VGNSTKKMRPMWMSNGTELKVAPHVVGRYQLEDAPRVWCLKEAGMCGI